MAPRINERACAPSPTTCKSRRHTSMHADANICDVIIVGAGPAGMAAACRAAEAGARAVVLDEGHGPGGQIWRPSVKGAPPAGARRWLNRLESSRAVVHRSTSVFDVRASPGE